MNQNRPIDKQAFAFGVAAECAAQGIDPNSLVRKSAFCDSTYRTLEFQKLAGAVGRTLLAAGGYADSYAYHAMNYLASITEPIKSAACISQWVAPPVTTLYEVAERLCEEQGVKRAGAVKALIGKTIGRVLSTTPEAAKLLAMGAVATGGAGGALAFALNRDSRDDDSEIALKEEQAKYYRNYAKELSEKIHASGGSDAAKSKAVEKAISEISEPDEQKPYVL